MKVFSLPNNRSTRPQEYAITPDTLPGLTRPKFKDKAAYRKWCESKNTEHAFISTVEGLQPGVRVSASNPATFLHGIVGEFDAEQDDNWAERMRRADLAPTYGCRTFSGHARAWWEFKQPINISNRKLREVFLKMFYQEVKALGLVPGFKEAESSNVAQYYEIGHDWVATGGTVDQFWLEGLLARASMKVDWRKEGPSLPIAKLREEGERQFPGRWTNGWESFEYGARGVRFWTEEGDAQSVLVTETGCVCFTGDNPFMPWAAIFGHDFVRRTADTVVGEAIQGINYDAGAKNYWTNDSNRGFLQVGVESIRRRLQAAGLSSGCRKGETISELDAALLTIERTRAVSGPYEAWHRPQRIVYVAQKPWLNISDLRLEMPAPGLHKDLSQAPWLAEFFPAFLGTRQLQVYNHWLAHFYLSCLAGKPVRGLSLFIAGPIGCGKTFLNKVLHAMIFGCAADASKYFMGTDQFNANLFASPIWRADDAVPSSDAKFRDKFSQIIKSVVANDEFIMRGMYREGITLPWMGRCIVTMNADPESLRLLPSTEMNLMDKFILLQARPHKVKFPDDDVLRAELPHFLAYLRDMPKDPALWVGGRFGVLAYHDPDLLRLAQDSEATTDIYELIYEWAEVHFSKEGAGANADSWTGTPTALLHRMEELESLKSLAARTVPRARVMGRALNSLIARDVKWLSFKRQGGTGQRLYTVERSILGDIKYCHTNSRKTEDATG
jgi:hypothetical protein